jgi:TRAP-type transport system small permease protein
MLNLLHQLTEGFFKLLQIIMVACITVMLVMVFGNVVARIGFNTGWDLRRKSHASLLSG